MLEYALKRGGHNMISNHERYVAFKEKQFEVWYNYSERILKSPVFKRIYASLASLDLKGNLDTRDEQIDLLKLKRNVLLMSKSVLEGVNTEVEIIAKDDVQRILSLAKTGFSREKWEREALRISRVGSIFDIPLEKTHKFDSSIYHIECRVAAYRKQLFSYIEIGTPYDPVLAEAEYAHELGHALIARNIDSLLNPLFDEYISMFLELLYLFFSKDNLYGFKIKCVDRILDCQENGKSTLLELRYLFSSLLTFITLEQFLEFSSKDRNEMLMKIKKVLNGQMTVENFLDEYNFNLETDRSEMLVNKMIDRIHI